MSNDSNTAIDILLVLRKQLSDLRDFAQAEAGSGNYDLVPDFTGGTVSGIEMAINMVDGNLAFLTQDRAAIAEIFAKAQQPLPGVDE